jgi:hypothetical protein
MRLGLRRSFIRRWSITRVVSLVLLTGGGALGSAAHPKARSIEPLDASFHMGDSGTIEASLNPPIQGVLRIIVRARAFAGRPQQGSAVGARPPQSDFKLFTLEVMQWDRPIPFRLISQGGRHNPFGGRPSSLVADIDVNDLTPGVPVRVSIHSNFPAPSNSAPPDLEAHAYAVVY